jgi:hypothetical protein
MSRLLAIFAVGLLAASGAFAQSSNEIAALRAELQQMRMELNQTRALLAEAQRDIADLTGSTSDRQALLQWRSERAQYEAEQRALTRERIRLEQAREALTRAAAAESRKVEALQSEVASYSQPLDKLPPRSSHNELGYGYTQQYGWPYAYGGTWLGYPGYGSYFSTGIYRPYYRGYYPYSYRPYFYRPRIYRSGIHFGYHDDHFRFRLHSDSDHRRHDRPDTRDAVTPPLAPPAIEHKPQITPWHRPEITRPHPAFQLRLRDN